MNAKQITISLIMVFCTVVLLGQEGITEGSTIVLNRGNLRVSQTDILPKFNIRLPVLDGQKLYQTTNKKIEIVGKIVNHEGIETLVIHGSHTLLEENGTFKDSIELQPGIQEIKMTAYLSDNQIDSSFSIEYLTPRMEFARDAINESTYHALIIGINEYSDSNFPTLDRPVKDAKELFQVLTTKYAFETDNTKLLEDPEMSEIEREFDNLIDNVKSNDNLLIFFAGHGEWNEESGVGYWIPADAVNGRYSTYFENRRLVTFIQSIRAKHTLVIADACLAGALFTTRSVVKDPDRAIREEFQRPSCKVMTSASFKETDDKSVFAKFLIEDLNESDEIVITALALYSRLYQPVKDNGGDPQYGNIKINRDRGGQFIFIRKQD